MFKIALTFLITFLLFFFGIYLFRKMSGMEKLNLMKLLAYATLIALLTTASLFLLVVLF